MFAGIPVVALLQAGFLGFSIIVLILSFMLLSTLVKSTGASLDNLKQKTFAIQSFMMLNVVCLTLGLLFVIFDQTKHVNITVDMSEYERDVFKKVRLITGGGYGEFDEEGQTKVKIKNEQRITIGLNPIDNFIRDMEINLERLNLSVDQYRNQVEGLKQQNKTFVGETFQDVSDLTEDSESGI